MAKPKQGDDTKVNHGDKKSLLDDVVESGAFENETVDPAGKTVGQNGPALQSAPPRVSSVALVSLITSLMAMAGVGFLHFKINTDTDQALSARDAAQADFYEMLGDRLDDVDARLSVFEITASTLRKENNEFKLKLGETARASVNDFTAVQSAMGTRLDDVETQLAELLADEVSVLDVGVRNNSATKDGLAEALFLDQAMSHQVAVLIVMGLLSDDAAGRSLARWSPALSSYANSDEVPASVEQVVEAAIRSINASPPSATSLLESGLELAAMMAISVNDAGDDASLIERARAGLGQMLRLRSTSIIGDDPQSQLARFDLALSRRDLLAAANIAGMWNGSEAEGLEGWHESALSRLALDKALADLTEAIVRMLD